MSELDISLSAEESYSLPPSRLDIAEFVELALAMGMPPECAAGVADTWWGLVEHWALLRGTGSA